MAQRTKRKGISFDIMEKYAPNFERALRNHGLEDEADEFMASFKSLGADIAELQIDPTWGDEILASLESAATGYRGKKGEIQAYRSMKSSPDKAITKSVEAFFIGIIPWLKKDAINGWLYSFNQSTDVKEAWLITNIFYVKERRWRSDGEVHRDPPYVTVEMTANAASLEDGRWRGLKSTQFSIHESDIGKSLTEVLFDKGFQKESAELKAEYEHDLQRFQGFVGLQGKQFTIHGKTHSVERETNWWDYRNRKVKTAEDEWDDRRDAARVVNDEVILQRRIVSTYKSEFWADHDCEQFNVVPIHPYIFCFDMNRHKNCWVHVSNMDIYLYDKSLREKIVLQDEHRDLIEILTMDLDIFKENGDVIKGKSGGTSILCVGPPGLGKTLSAEVYAEVAQRPLYKVHSGELGITPDQVEKNLKIYLMRAERWDAALLIDEADIYIRKRGDDINHNAIVATMLKTLEYFNGLLFMTTNRENDVDDAVLSRMIAIFKFTTPQVKERRQIWEIMVKEFGIKVQPEVLDQLADKMEISGRDIKQLVKLTARYVEKKKIPYSYEPFRICSMVRGV